MPKISNQKGLVQIILLFIILAGIAGGVFLVTHPTIFKPKAAINQTGIEFVDSNGDAITQTNTNQVKIKLNYVLPSASPTSPPAIFPENFKDVTLANGFRYGAQDDTGVCMDTAKIIDNPRGGYLAVYHCLGNGVFRVYLGTSKDILNWQQVGMIDDYASQPTIFTTSTDGFIVAEEVTQRPGLSGNHIRFFYYNGLDDLLSNKKTAQFDAEKTLSQCNEGTPNIYSVNLSPDINHSIISVGFHFHWNCDVDRIAKGTLTNFSSWSATPEDSMNSQLANFGLQGNFGGRDYVQIQGKSYNLQEAQGAKNDWSLWKVYLYDYSTQQFSLFNIHTANGSHSFANPKITIVTTPAGKSALAITSFIPSEGSATDEPPGALIYYKEFNQPSTPSFPTSFRIASIQAELVSASEQDFNINGKIIDWSLAGDAGQKTVFAQFKVDGAWGEILSTSINYASLSPSPSPSPSSTPSPSPSPTQEPTLTPSPTPSPSPSPSPTPAPLVGDINNDNTVNQSE